MYFTVVGSSQNVCLNREINFLCKELSSLQLPNDGRCGEVIKVVVSGETERQNTSLRKK